MTRSTWLPALAAVVLLGSEPPLNASELHPQIDGLANDIARVLKDEGQTQVAVQEFTSLTAPTNSAGPLIQSALIDV